MVTDPPRRNQKRKRRKRMMNRTALTKPKPPTGAPTKAHLALPPRLAMRATILTNHMLVEEGEAEAGAVAAAVGAVTARETKGRLTTLEARRPKRSSSPSSLPQLQRSVDSRGQ